MDINKAFWDITNRVSNSVIQKRFRSLGGLTAGQSAIKTRDKISDIVQQNKPKDIAILHDVINWYLNDYFFHGEKGVHIYDAEPEIVTAIIESLKQITIPESPYQLHFPWTVPHNDFDETSSQSHLVKITEYDDGLAVIFSTTRYYTERVVISKNHLKEDLQDNYSDVLEFVGDRKKYRQFFDMLIIKPDGHIEMRIDNPVLDGSKQMPYPERKKAFSEVAYAFNELISTGTGLTWTLPIPANLIYTIDILYRKKLEGQVRQINFTTDDSGSKEIKVNASDKNACCRRDLFTKAGTKAVHEEGQEISPYRIFINWEKELSHFPELQILGTKHNLDVSKNPINEAIISKCLTKSDYDFIRDKVLANRSYDQPREQQQSAE